MDILLLIFKISLLYFAIVILYWFIGKRKINELSIMDLIVIMLLSNMVTNNVLDFNNSLLYLMIPILFIIVLQLIMTYLAPKVPYIKYMFEGAKPIIISKGRLNFNEMIKRQYNLNTLLKELESKSFKRIEDVEYAFLENDGKLKSFGYTKNSEPIPIILDGKIQYSSLKILNKDDSWLNKMVINQNISLDDIFYAFYKQGRLYIIRN